MKFQKGNKINLGRKHTEESNEKNRQKHLGKSSWNKGLTKETDERVKKSSERTVETKIKNGTLSLKGERCPSYGRKRSSEANEKNRQAHLGTHIWYEKGRVPPMKGKHSWILGLTKETDERVRKGAEKKRNRKFAQEHRRKLVIARNNRVFPLQDTSIEVKIQNYLKELQIPLITHRYMKEIEHSYQCDIFVPSMNLVIECDGDYWHDYPYGKEKDHIRTKELKEYGFNVLRLWEHEINKITLNEFQEKIKMFEEIQVSA